MDSAQPTTIRGQLPDHSTIRGQLPDHTRTPLHRVPERDRIAVLARLGPARETGSAFQSSGSVEPAP
ncbi:hypothetical protein [Streptomyces sp. NPDC020965]|uniref:hypothetical protein n=1 Tax=Streptomyces sp. NPDC020965 TaxID=3365105 RepID=UPI0037A84DBA